VLRRAEKSHLSRLGLVNIEDVKINERVQMGEEIILARDGKPIARLSPKEPKAGVRRLGSAAGEFQAPDDFNAPLPPEIEGTFWG